MTQIAQPELHVSTLRSHRGLVLTCLAALALATTAVTLVLTLGSSHNSTSVPGVRASAAGIDAGPTAGTPSAVAQTFGSERVRGGTSLTTNLPAPARSDSGPARGTPAVVAEALQGSEPGFELPNSLTTNVPAPPRADAGPATGTPAAVRDAVSGR